MGQGCCSVVGHRSASRVRKRVPRFGVQSSAFGFRVWGWELGLKGLRIKGLDPFGEEKCAKFAVIGRSRCCVKRLGGRCAPDVRYCTGGVSITLNLSEVLQTTRGSVRVRWRGKSRRGQKRAALAAGACVQIEFKARDPRPCTPKACLNLTPTPPRMTSGVTGTRARTSNGLFPPQPLGALASSFYGEVRG